MSFEDIPSKLVGWLLTVSVQDLRKWHPFFSPTFHFFPHFLHFPIALLTPWNDYQQIERKELQFPFTSAYVRVAIPFMVIFLVMTKTIARNTKLLLIRFRSLQCDSPPNLAIHEPYTATNPTTETWNPAIPKDQAGEDAQPPEYPPHCYTYRRITFSYRYFNATQM